VNRGEDNTTQHEGRPQRAQSVEFCPAGGWPVLGRTESLADGRGRTRSLQTRRSKAVIQIDLDNERS